MSPKRWPLAVAIVLSVAALAAAGAPSLTPGLAGLVERARGAGAAGAALYGLVFAAAAALMFPKALLAFGAGFAFGALPGAALSLAASVLGAAAAFLLGRTLARDWVARRLEASPRLKAVDDAVARDGAWIVLLLRLSPVFPYGLVNYALGLTRLRASTFVAASAVGMVPLTVLYASLGALAPTAAAAMQGRPEGADGWRLTLLIVGVAATAGVALLLARAARRGLDARLGGGDGNA